MTPWLKKIVISFLFSALLLCFFTKAQAQYESDYAVYANIIYRFTKYIEWPDEKKSGDFVIGVAGNSPFFDDLNHFISNKTAGSQKIVVKRFTTSSSTFNCHILYIGEEAMSSFKKIVLTTMGTSTLLVTESEGLASKDSCINFVIIQDRLKLEINKNNIEQREMNIATELLNLGKLVK